MADDGNTAEWFDRPTDLGPPATESVGDRFGPYRLLSVLGEGGFGVVYLAEQTEPLRRRVALKVIKPGMDSRQVLARFEAERRALAMMDHPGVARALDAGATPAGRPFFVMELVRGEPVTDFCDRNRLDLSERLRLMARACDAVQHAHTKGVVHRDLKPSNILVSYGHDGRPRPKVIDFGVAKALHQPLTEHTIVTGVGQAIGTPEYMSPEQAEMTPTGVDTRADVYSLGALLYELLSGVRPHSFRGSAPADIQRLIRETDPPRPSTRLSTLRGSPSDPADAQRIAHARRADAVTLVRRLRGDLDRVVMRCLEKDRERRYQTASELAAELRRVLNREPVLAVPPSPWYRARRFAARNRVLVGSAAAVAAALLVATAVSLRFAVDAGTARAETAAALDRALDAERAAVRRADELRRVAEFQSAQLAAIDPAVLGAALKHAVDEQRDTRAGDHDGWINYTSVARTGLDRAFLGPTRDAIDRSFADQPLVRARLLGTLADVAAELGLPGFAVDTQARAAHLHAATQGPDHPDAIDARSRLAAHHALAGDPDAARRLADDALADAERSLQGDHPARLRALARAGRAAHSAGDIDAADPLLTRALQQQTATLGDDHPDTLDSSDALGALRRDQGRLDEANRLLRNALDRRRDALGPDHPRTLDSLNNVAALERSRGDLDEAEHLLRTALQGRRRTLGDGHPLTLHALNNLGLVLLDTGDAAAAEQLFREALRSSRRSLGPAHPDTLTALNSVALVLQQTGRLDEAAPLLQECLDGSERVLGPEHPDTLATLNNLGGLLRALGRLDDAEPVLRDAARRTARALGPDHPNALAAASNHALTLAELGRPEPALDIIDAVVRRGVNALGADHWFVANFRGKRGRILTELDRLDDARDELARAYQLLTSSLGPDHPQARRVAGYRALLCQRLDARNPAAGHRAEADRWARIARGEPADRSQQPEPARADAEPAAPDD